MGRVMIVEDEVILTMAIRQALEVAGYEVISPVLSGESAIEHLQDDQPDLILMDVTLQGRLDGVTTTNLINAKYDVPIVITTAHSDAVMIERIENSTAVGFLEKPININEMISLISTML